MYSPYKKSVYGNDTFYIRAEYVFVNSVTRFRIFYTILFFCDFFLKKMVGGIFTEFLKNVKNISFFNNVKKHPNSNISIIFLTFSVAAQNIRGGLSHLTKQLAILGY